MQASIVGYVKDVVTQLRRGLDGFWVAHPSFVRIGVALVAAWRRRERDAADDSLMRRASAPPLAQRSLAQSGAVWLSVQNTRKQRKDAQRALCILCFSAAP